MAPPTALLIDLDGVIRRWSSEDSLIEAAHGLPIGAISRVAFAPEFLLPAISGRISDEAWRGNIAERLLRSHPTSDVANAVAKWSAPPGQVSPDVIAVLSRCRLDLRVVLATNATSRLGSDLRELNLESRFHAIANSSEIGAAKPHAEFFSAALRIAAAAAGNALFVDDSLTNVVAATRLGIRSHHFNGHAGLAKFLLQAGAIRENAL